MNVYYLSENMILKMLTSNPLVMRSCSTAQPASRSRPLTFNDPNDRLVGVTSGGWGFRDLF